MTQNFEMSDDDLAELLKAMQPVPYTSPRSLQENANAAWALLGLKLGFDPMTVHPNRSGDRFFSAEKTMDRNL